MKNKLKKTMTALCAALILMGGFPVPAYAQGAATEPPAGDATNDSNVVVEEKEETPPLTPKGNATLVDDYGGNKQLITVTTKGGNYQSCVCPAGHLDKPAAYRRMGKQSDADCQRQGRPRRIYGGYRGYGAGTGKDLSVSF